MHLHIWHLVLLVLAQTYYSLQIEGEDNSLNHKCNRPCTNSPMVCQYTLEIETYSTMPKACKNFPFDSKDMASKPQHCIVGDGVARKLYAVNRTLPAPQIRVCEGDTLQVKVINDMTDGEGTSIHWHGIHQTNSVYMDGVAMVTQCPIEPYSNEYNYTFVVDRAGTHYYHAHVGMQRGEGIAGALIVRPNTDNVFEDLPEHTIIIQDWFNRSASDKGIAHLHGRGKNHPDSILINGAATRTVQKGNPGGTISSEKIPPSVFNVESGETYRFRIISNAVMNCPIEVYIDNHDFEVISSDGDDIEPVKGDVLVISGGERWDFLLYANATKAGNHFMYFRGIVDCSNVALQSVAVLHYNGTQDVTSWLSGSPYEKGYNERPKGREVTVVNPFMGITNPPTGCCRNVKLTDMRPKEPPPSWLLEDEPVAVRQYLEIDLNQLNNIKYNLPILYPCTPPDSSIDPDKTRIQDCTVLAQINRVNGKLPPAPLYGQIDDIEPTDFCEVGTPKNCDKEFCYCIHYMKVEVNQIVELVLVDVGTHFNNSNHPMHIHGQYVHVLAMGQNPWYQTNASYVRDLDARGEIKRNLKTPVRKDNIMMPVGGYAVVRFKATNPGPWLFHCHNELHVEQGMFMVIQVGEPSQWPKSEPQTYRCGPYSPTPVATTCSSTNLFHFTFSMHSLMFFVAWMAFL